MTTGGEVKLEDLHEATSCWEATPCVNGSVVGIRSSGYTTGLASPTSRVEVVEKDMSIAPATVPAARYEAFGLNANAADLCASLRDAMLVQLRRCKVTDQEYDVQQTAMACKNTIQISGSGMTIVVLSCGNFQRLAPLCTWARLHCRRSCSSCLHAAFRIPRYQCMHRPVRRCEA